MTKTFKKSAIATLAVVTLATSGIFNTANAGSRDFVRGAIVGAIGTAVVVGSARRHREREVIYVERETYHEADGHAWSDAQHDRWCHRKYRSYSSRTGKYVSLSGHRRYCNSPYGG